MEYVSQEYQQRLDELAETLMKARREQSAPEVGQIALFEVQDVSRAS